MEHDAVQVGALLLVSGYHDRGCVAEEHRTPSDHGLAEDRNPELASFQDHDLLRAPATLQFMPLLKHEPLGFPERKEFVLTVIVGNPEVVASGVSEVFAATANLLHHRLALSRSKDLEPLVRAHAVPGTVSHVPL